VRIWNAGLKGAARGSLQMQDAKKSPKIAIWAPSHNFVGLYLFFFFYLSIFFSSPNLSGHTLDVCHTSTHGVALVQI